MKKYIRNLPITLDNTIFRKGPRISTLKDDIAPNLPLIRPRKIAANNAVKMAQYVLELAKKSTDRHQTIKDFFLINDSATVAMEIPVFLKSKEAKSLGLTITRPLTGHIDILQVRKDRIHILDYKLGARSETQAARQLFLYALALGKRTRIPLEHMTCAYFDENAYFQFKPVL